MQISLKWRRCLASFFLVSRDVQIDSRRTWIRMLRFRDCLFDCSRPIVLLRATFYDQFCNLGDCHRRNDGWWIIDRCLDRLEGIEVTKINRFRIINICCLRNDRLRAIAIFSNNLVRNSILRFMWSMFLENVYIYLKIF